MHQGIVDRLPRGVALGAGIVILIAVANGRDRTPELVVILGVEHCNRCVGAGHRGKSHEPRTVDHAHLLCLHHLADDRFRALRPGDEPEAGVLGLPIRPLGAGPAPGIGMISRARTVSRFPMSKTP